MAAKTPLRAPGDDVVLDPVWPNAGVHDWYYQRLHSPLAYCFAEIETNLSLDYARGVQTVGMAADAPSVLSMVQRSLDKWAKKWTKTWDDMAVNIASDFASRSRRATDNATMAAFKKAGFTVKFQLTRGMRDSFKAVVQTNVELIRSIPEQYLKDVKVAVYTNLTTGGGDMESLRQNIQRIYGITDRRAAFIARDQTNKAHAVYEEARRTELGIEEAEWQHSGAGQEKYKRITHVKAGRLRTRYKIKDGWIDPEDGKPTWPGHKPNCRCTSRTVIPGMREKVYRAV